jgi:tetratricopeptide (TPR) repeat protein
VRPTGGADPAAGGVSKRAWGTDTLIRLLPWVVLGGLTLWGILAGFGDGPFEWLADAQRIVSRTGREGSRALLSPGAWTDPRTIPSALVLLLGGSDGLAVHLLRLLALACAAACISGLMPRGGARGGVLAASILASSPVLVRAILEVDAHLVPGLLLLLVGQRRLPVWVRGLGVGWALGWSPWAWIALPLAVAAGFMGPGRSRRDAAAVLILGIGLAGALWPQAIAHPAAWLEGMLRKASAEGLGGAPPFGVRPGFWPLWNTLHVPALLLVLGEAPRWPGRIRAGDWTPLACVVVLLLALPSGFAQRAPLLLLLPWAAGEAGSAWSRLASRLKAGSASAGGWRSRAAASVLAGAAAVPLLVTSAMQFSRPRDFDDARTAAWSYLEENLPEGGLVAHDLALAPPQQSRLTWVPIPFHSTEPERHRGAYWQGWYAGFNAVALSERTVNRFLRLADDLPEAVSFYLWIADHARSERIFGEQPGQRVHIVLLPEPSAEGMSPGWRERVSRGEAGGLQGDFLARLGGGLIRAGRAEAGAALLAEALDAGYEDLGIYLNLGSGYLKLGRALDAGRVLEQGSARYPDSADLLYNLALVLVEVGYWDRAVRTLERLRELWPRSAGVTYLLGVSLANSGREGAARALLQEALTLDPDAEQRQRIIAALETLREGR